MPPAQPSEAGGSRVCLFVHSPRHAAAGSTSQINRGVLPSPSAIVAESSTGGVEIENTCRFHHRRRSVTKEFAHIWRRSVTQELAHIWPPRVKFATADGRAFLVGEGSYTWASYEQGTEAYLQGTSQALLAAYEEFVPNVVALLPSGSQMLEPGSGGLSQRLQ